MTTTTTPATATATATTAAVTAATSSVALTAAAGDASDGPPEPRSSSFSSSSSSSSAVPSSASSSCASCSSSTTTASHHNSMSNDDDDDDDDRDGDNSYNYSHVVMDDNPPPHPLASSPSSHQDLLVWGGGEAAGRAMTIANEYTSDSYSTPAHADSCWSPQTEDFAAVAMARCRDIIACREQIRIWKTRLHRLRSECKQIQLQAVMRTHKGPAVWTALSRRDKWKVPIILALLEYQRSHYQNQLNQQQQPGQSSTNNRNRRNNSDRHTGTTTTTGNSAAAAAAATPPPTLTPLPHTLQEVEWDRSVPKFIQHDRDLLLARLARPDFRQAYEATSVTQQHTQQQQQQQQQQRFHPSYTSSEWLLAETSYYATCGCSGQHNPGFPSALPSSAMTNEGPSSSPDTTSWTQLHDAPTIGTETMSSATPRFLLPAQFTQDKQVLMAVLRVYPEFMLHQRHVLSDALLQDPDLVRAFCNSPHAWKISAASALQSHYARTQQQTQTLSRYPFGSYCHIHERFLFPCTTTTMATATMRHQQLHCHHHQVTSLYATAVPALDALYQDEEEEQGGAGQRRSTSTASRVTATSTFTPFLRTNTLSTSMPGVNVNINVPLLSLSLFPESIRANADLMLELIEYSAGGAAVLYHVAPALRTNVGFAVRAVQALQRRQEWQQRQKQQQKKQQGHAIFWNDSSCCCCCYGCNCCCYVCSHSTNCTTAVPPDILRRFANRLRADKSLVMQICQLQGHALQYASYHVRRDPHVVRVAVTQSPTALVHALPGTAKKQLLRNVPFMVQLFRRLRQPFHTLPHHHHHRDHCYHHDDCLHYTALKFRLWHALPTPIKQHPEIVLAALVSGCIPDPVNSGALQPFYLAYERYADSLWLLAVQQAPMIYAACLPVDLMHRPEFGRQALLHAGRQQRGKDESASLNSNSVVPLSQAQLEVLVVEVMSRFPGFASDVDLFRQLSPSIVALPFMMRIASAAIRADRAIMLPVIRCNGASLEYLEPNLVHDHDILLAAVEQHYSHLELIPPAIQWAMPDVVVAAIRNTPRDDLYDVYEWIDVDMWEVKQVALAWAGQGGDYLHDEFPSHMEDDVDLFLEIAQHNWTEFWCASKRLCRNKNFMLQAVARDGRVLREATGPLCQDFDVALTAFATTADLVDYYDMHDRDEFEFLTQFAQRVRERIGLHEAFVKTVLCPLSSLSLQSQSLSNNQTSSDKERNNSTKKLAAMGLAVLNQGQETALAYKKLIAEYLGIPVGTELLLLRQASINLLTWGF